MSKASKLFADEEPELRFTFHLVFLERLLFGCVLFGWCVFLFFGEVFVLLSCFAFKAHLVTRPLSNDSMLGVAKIATIIMMSAASIKKMVCPHFRRLTCSGAVWLLSDDSVTSVIHHLGIAQRGGVRGEASWIVHNGEILHSDKVFLGQGDVMMFWQKDEFELMEGTVSPTVNRGNRPLRLEQSVRENM